MIQDHSVYLFDTRNAKNPLHILQGHAKSVSYVKYVSKNTIVSASTDSTLRAWSLNESSQNIMKYKSHINEKNFVGLGVNSDATFFACGSEDNRVYIYHNQLSSVWLSDPMGLSIEPVFVIFL